MRTNRKITSPLVKKLNGKIGGGIFKSKGCIVFGCQGKAKAKQSRDLASAPPKNPI